MSKLPTTPNNLKQPSPDNNGLARHKQQSADVDTQAAKVNRDANKLEESDRLEKTNQWEESDKSKNSSESEKANTDKSKAGHH